MKRSLLIGAAACVLAAMPVVSGSAMPRAAAHAPGTDSDALVVLAHGDHEHAFGHAARVERERDRDEAWARGLRRFRSSFD